MNPPAGSRPLTGLSRRRFGTGILKAGLASLALPSAFQQPGWAAAPSVLLGNRPEITHGVMSGDVTTDSAVIWSRTTRPARMVVEWSLKETFRDARRIEGPVTGPEADFTAKTQLKGLPAGRRVFYRVRFEDRGSPGEAGPSASGQLLTAPRDRRNILFAWSGDTAGQGYGIDPAFGGMRTYASLHAAQPDFFVHSGDTIYADGPLPAQIQLPNGGTWRNELSPEKSKVAETLAEFRGNHRYNLQDPQVRDCYAHVPILAQWDDHEVRNNWYPGQTLNEDSRYTEKSVDVLAAHARRAFLDYMPIRPSADPIIYRSVARGPLCDLFFLDLRSYRGPNGANRQPTRSRETDFMGGTQLGWLKQSMKASRALWKVVCTDMPLALLVGDGVDRWEAWANGDHGVPLGRELEIADLLAFLKANSIQNVIFLTADVHYAASHRYDPSRAKFTEFNPFWEFVSGPLHAMSLAAGTLDRTFGPEAVWASRPAGSAASGPFSREQYFGTVGIDGRSGELTVTHFDREGTRLNSTTLEAHAS